MDKIFKNHIGRNVEAYIDDILVLSKDKENYLANLEETLPHKRKVGLRLKAKKCMFGIIEGQFLGFQITPNGTRAMQEKIEAAAKIGPPRTIKKVQ